MGLEGGYKNKCTEKREQNPVLFVPGLVYLFINNWYVSNEFLHNKNPSKGPAEILFWRAIWESNREIFDNDIFQRNLIARFIQSKLLILCFCY